MRTLTYRMLGRKYLRGVSLSVVLTAAIVLIPIGTHAQASETETTPDESAIVSTTELVERLIPITGDEGLITERNIDLDIRFSLGSAGLDQISLAQIEALANALAASELADAAIKIYGHTDSIGSEASNQALSEARAASVLEAILGLVELDPSRIESSGFGESRLKDPENPTSAVNRRVEIVAIYRAEIVEGESEQSVKLPSTNEVIDVAPEEGLMIID